MENKKHFCILPWIHLHTWPNGNGYLCCVSDSGKPLGKLSEDVSLKDLWNADRMKEVRLAFMKDEPVEECRRCYEIEASGAPSTRQNSNAFFAKHLDRVRQTNSDGSLDEMNQAFMDIRFSNICNLRCRTCGHGLSSRWLPDAVKMGFTKKTIAIQKPYEEPLRLFEQLEEVLPTVEVIYFAGGEPLLTEEHYRIIKWLVEHNRTDVELRYNSNFSIMSYKDINVFDLWPMFKRISVGASLDATYQRGEYMRKETEWDNVVRNRREMIAKCPNVSFYVNCTFSVFNFMTMIDFHREWVEEGLISADDWNINYLTGPNHYRADVAPEELRLLYVQKYVDYLQFMIKTWNVNKTTIQRWSSVSNFLRGPQDSQAAARFKDITSRLDEIRGENFASVFPELAFLME